MDDPNQIGDAPIDPQLDMTMYSLAQGIDEIINGDWDPKKNGFLLMVFPFAGFDGRCNYVSNARREDVIRLLEELLAKFKGQAS